MELRFHYRCTNSTVDFFRRVLFGSDAIVRAETRLTHTNTELDPPIVDSSLLFSHFSLSLTRLKHRSPPSFSYHIPIPCLSASPFILHPLCAPSFSSFSLLFFARRLFQVFSLSLTTKPHTHFLLLPFQGHLFSPSKPAVGIQLAYDVLCNYYDVTTLPRFLHANVHFYRL